MSTAVCLILLDYPVAGTCVNAEFFLILILKQASEAANATIALEASLRGLHA